LSTQALLHVSARVRLLQRHNDTHE